MLNTVLMFVQLVIAILLTVGILLQHRASGLSATFGGTGAAYVQRRGAEKVLFSATVVLSVAFFVLATIQMYLGS